MKSHGCNLLSISPTGFKLNMFMLKPELALQSAKPTSQNPSVSGPSFGARTYFCSSAGINSKALTCWAAALPSPVLGFLIYISPPNSKPMLLNGALKTCVITHPFSRPFSCPFTHPFSCLVSCCFPTPFPVLSFPHTVPQPY